MPEPSRRRTIVLVGLALAAVTLLVYVRVVTFTSISFDDPEFIGRPEVKGGLTARSIEWATTAVVAMWHPITFLSHLLDAELFGERFGLHHLTSVFFHVASTVLLFAWLWQMTDSIWRSAFVAGLFALHPLHVESVAWISERKDVLSTFFFLLMMIAYVRYTRAGSIVQYGIAWLLFALGLMSKPMLVTAPAIMLLCDVWPLDRPRRWGHLIAEKLPFVALAIADGVVTFLLQQQSGAVRSIDRISLSMRLANAIVSYVRYLGKTIWPTKLSVFYPYPDHWSLLLVIAASLLLVLITIACLYKTRSRPHLLFGWLWFLGTLLPVIGIIQVGEQAIADRYTYLPLIGPFIALAWTLRERESRFVLAAASLVVLGALTFVQLGHWRNSRTLFTHAVAVTRDNWLAYNHLATALRNDGEIGPALEAARRVVAIKPNYAIGHYNLGNTLLAAGDAPGAIDAYQKAIAINPNLAAAHNNLGRALVLSDRIPEAITHFSAAVQADPNTPEWRKNLAAATRLLHQRGPTTSPQ